MRTILAMILIIVGYMIGRKKRNSNILSEHLTAEITKLFNELHSAIQYTVIGMAGILEKADKTYQYPHLTFLKTAVTASSQGQYMGTALCEAFDHWNTEYHLTSTECSVIKEVFCDIGAGSTGQEQAKLSYAIDQLSEILLEKKENNKKLRGYHETVFTLLGIAAAILVI